ncbi:hypothetical protein KDRO_A07630 [Kluyveromyces lactis]|nr:hypothetical protein KDRO_A07630 [Kluyveromyces lactis]
MTVNSVCFFNLGKRIFAVCEYANTFIHDSTRINPTRREWLSFNMYRMNIATAHIITDHMQTDSDNGMYKLGDIVTVEIYPSTQHRYYGYQNKFCLAAGQSNTMSARSFEFMK